MGAFGSEWLVFVKSFVTNDLLQTAISEIEAFLNDRPITNIPSEISDAEPLIPSNLLCGRRITCLPHQNRDPNMNLEHSHTLKPLVKNYYGALEALENEYLASLREFNGPTPGKNINHKSCQHSTTRRRFSEDVLANIDSY